MFLRKEKSELATEIEGKPYLLFNNPIENENEMSLCMFNSILIGLIEGNVGFYKASGLVSCFTDDLTDFKGNFQFYVNEMTFNELHEIAKLCVETMDNDQAFDFLANGNEFFIEKMVMGF